MSYNNDVEILEKLGSRLIMFSTIFQVDFFAFSVLHSKLESPNKMRNGGQVRASHAGRSQAPSNATATAATLMTTTTAATTTTASSLSNSSDDDEIVFDRLALLNARRRRRRQRSRSAARWSGGGGRGGGAEAAKWRFSCLASALMCSGLAASIIGLSRAEIMSNIGATEIDVYGRMFAYSALGLLVGVFAGASQFLQTTF